MPLNLNVSVERVTKQMIGEHILQQTIANPEQRKSDEISQTEGVHSEPWIDVEDCVCSQTSVGSTSSPVSCHIQHSEGGNNQKKIDLNDLVAIQVHDHHQMETKKKIDNVDLLELLTQMLHKANAAHKQKIEQSVRDRDNQRNRQKAVELLNRYLAAIDLDTGRRHLDSVYAKLGDGLRETQRVTEEAGQRQLRNFKQFKLECLCECVYHGIRDKCLCTVNGLRKADKATTDEQHEACIDVICDCVETSGHEPYTKVVGDHDQIPSDDR